MEPRKRWISPWELIPELLAAMEQGQIVSLTISGNSMTPFLVSGRDTVFLGRVELPLKTGDMVLYQRRTGQYVLHRICDRRGETYQLVGDAQTAVEEGICREQILARVVGLRRKGKLQGPGSFWWEFFRLVWVRMIPLRPGVMKLYRMLNRK